MRSVRLLVSCVLLLSSSLLIRSQSIEGRVTFAEEKGEESGDVKIGTFDSQQSDGRFFNGTRQSKNLFDWIGIGIERNVDPYLAKIKKACLNGELAECFKSEALTSFSEFFDQTAYALNENVKVVQMSRQVVADVNRQPYEYSTEPRSDESEWDQLVKFASRKMEKFVKTMAIELEVPTSEIGENEVYSPRFIDEIADEIDTLEDKKDSLFSRHRFRKLLIPMLIVLKLFKLKLLLFLPLIFGLVSFKKFLTFLAIVVPGVIGFLKLYKPQNYQPPFYSQNGIGYPYYKEPSGQPYPYVNHNTEYDGNYHGDTVSYGQDLAYRGYREYQS
ncbi:uncharacterized protein LOC122637633 isoform X1 [Vespula pensylvanica]|uniref:Osiris 2 n=1 Tax=Vespula pensylvanica TaxID=30213 RepID=A0A834UET8_VESPE|nr:uncharacterized protein LOC122637633 isoform X1 [Vespula pensylvanica]XP_043685825.1 uncharacterized protein LOC122637633 isoform X1 [Vespula pensylvanica]KAF7434947.1 hypothetical protein H0235_003138 [Vespula pensylvanica]